MEDNQVNKMINSTFFLTKLIISFKVWLKLKFSLTISPLNNFILTLQVGLLLSTSVVEFLFICNTLIFIDETFFQ